MEMEGSAGSGGRLASTSPGLSPGVLLHRCLCPGGDRSPALLFSLGSCGFRTRLGILQTHLAASLLSHTAPGSGVTGMDGEICGDRPSMSFLESRHGC